MPLRLVSGPATEPVTVLTVKDNSRIDGVAEDSLIASWITAARLVTEHRTQRALITQTWELTLPRFPMGREVVELQRPPVQSVTSVAYVDQSGTEITMAAEGYVLVKGSPAELHPAPGTHWPAVQADNPEAVTVTFVAGYGAQSSDVPAALRDAVILRAATRGEHREDMVVGSIVSRINASEALEDRYMWDSGIA